MPNAITQAHSLGAVVFAINQAFDGHAVAYAGGSDLRDAHVMAGQYAWEAAQESGYFSDETIEAHLDILTEHGAWFDYAKALQNAIERRTECDIE